MDADLELLKSTLNSLVVSSPSQMDMRTLMKDYRNMIGSDIPIAKHGYRDMPTFLKERCSDCFVLSGPLRNPVLTLVVKDSLKHIDNFVQKQKSANINKWLGKRRSIPAAAIAPTPNNRNDTPKFRPTSNNNSSYVQRSEPVKKSVNNLPLTIKEKSQPIEISTNKVRNTAPSPSPPQRIQSREESDDISNKLAVQNFFKKRMPSECLDPDFWVTDKDSAKSQDDDSGRITASSGGSSSRKLLREELSQEIRALVAEYPEGISSIDFTTLYRCRYGRDVPYQAWGCTSVLAAVRLAGGARVWRSPHAPDWTLLPEGAAAPSSLSPAHLPQFPPRSLTHSKEVIDPDDALPGMDFDPSVFPDDCIHYVESIAQESVSGLQPGDTVPVCVGEVYSPSHMWLLRLGPDHDVAMETIMDEMTQYYSSGEGRDRALCLGAARVGHYCAALFEQDWHRAVIVRVIDADTFKVRHIDYGTVARVSLYQLKPLLRRWCELPAQALRARLADVRTTARGTWPLPASLRLLDLVKEKRLVASVVTVHEEENAIDIILVDTSGEDDVVIGHQLVQSGHAVPALSPSSPRQVSTSPLSPSHPSHSPHSPYYTSSDSDTCTDVRSVLAVLTHFQPDPDIQQNIPEDLMSDVSASASEVVGAPPRRLKTWECDTNTVVSDVSEMTNVSVKVARLRALREQLRKREAEEMEKQAEMDSKSESSSSEQSVVSTMTALQKRLALHRLSQNKR